MSRKPVLREAGKNETVLQREPDMVPPARLPESAPSNDVGPEVRRVRSGSPSQHRFETARPVDANPACPRENAGDTTHRGVPGLIIVPARSPQERVSSRTMSCRATLAAERSGAPLPAANEAAGAPSAWSQSLTLLSRDHADGATLGRPRLEPRRTRRPVLNDGPSNLLSFNAIPIWFHQRGCPRVPPQTMLGPKCVAFGRVLLPNIGLRRHVRSTPIPRAPEYTRVTPLTRASRCRPESACIWRLTGACRNRL